MTYARLMRRALAATVVLALLAPVVAIAASIGEMPGCCARGDDRVTAAMACCETTICASPAPARQPKGTDVSVTTVVLAQLEPLSIIAPQHTPDAPQEVASPPPVRVRLALISTLLI